MTFHRSPFTVITDIAGPGWKNMAVDCALLDLAEGGAAFLRLYQWDPHCISFGRHEPALRRYDRARIDARGIDCVRRPTGGRAVWHADELTYAVAAPLAAFGGMRDAYVRIHAMLAFALTALGAEPELAVATGARPLSPGAGACFAAPVGGEVMLGRGKVVGSAQLRQGSAFLQHGSLLLAGDQSLLDELAGIRREDRAEISLQAALGRRVSFPEAADAVSKAATATWTAPDAELTELPTTALAGVERHAARFRDPAWTWQR